MNFLKGHQQRLKTDVEAARTRDVQPFNIMGRIAT